MRYGRQAYGPHRHMTEADKARHVARSIQGKVQQGRPWSFTEYGLDHNPAQQARVQQALRRLGPAREQV